MDTLLDKLLETIKEKMSKKQVIAIFGIVCLYLLGAPPLYIVIVTMYAITAQTILDFPKKENRNETSNNSNVPAGG